LVRATDCNRFNPAKSELPLNEPGEPIPMESLGAKSSWCRIVACADLAPAQLYCALLIALGRLRKGGNSIRKWLCLENLLEG
jgi:hypothetical protein